MVCLLLSVRHGLFGYADEGSGAKYGNGTLLPGSGELEEGILLALQALGGVCIVLLEMCTRTRTYARGMVLKCAPADTGVDEYVLKKDWPPIDTSLRFRRNFGLLLR